MSTPFFTFNELEENINSLKTSLLWMEKTKQASLKRNDVISASEIGQYVYCSRSWYLQKCGYKPDSPSLEVGKKFHVDLGKTMDSIQEDIRSSRRLAVIGYVFLIFAIIIILFGVI